MVRFEQDEAPLPGYRGGPPALLGDSRRRRRAGSSRALRRRASWRVSWRHGAVSGAAPVDPQAPALVAGAPLGRAPRRKNLRHGLPAPRWLRSGPPHPPPVGHPMKCLPSMPPRSRPWSSPPADRRAGARVGCDRVSRQSPSTVAGWLRTDTRGCRSVASDRLFMLCFFSDFEDPRNPSFRHAVPMPDHGRRQIRAPVPPQ